MQRASSIWSTIQYPPVAHGLQSDGRAFGKLGEEGADGTGNVARPSPLDQVPIPAEDGEERDVLLGITTDRMIRMEHPAPPVH